MRVPLVRQYLLQNKKRSLAAVAGISFSVVLLFIQVGFMANGKRISTLFYQYLDCDLIITSDKYQLIGRSGLFDKIRLVQANLVPGIEWIEYINYKRGQWRADDTNIISSAMIFGTPLKPEIFSDEKIRSGLPRLAATKTILLDRLSSDDYGAVAEVNQAAVNEQAVEVVARFSMGMRFHSDGAVIASHDTFRRLCPRDSRLVNFGLLKLEQGYDARRTKAALIKTLPRDVKVFTKAELIAYEQHYFLTVIPVGIMFQTGLILGLVVGGLVLYQVLFTDINRRLKEFATLKAMGFGHSRIYAVAVKMGLSYAITAYVPALWISYYTFQRIRIESKLPLLFTLNLMAVVFLLTISMCTIATLSALRVLRKADPVDLF